MKYAFESNETGDEANPFFEELDSNSVGKIDWKEFFSFWSK